MTSNLARRQRHSTSPYGRPSSVARRHALATAVLLVGCSAIERSADGPDDAAPGSAAEEAPLTDDGERAVREIPPAPEGTSGVLYAPTSRQELLAYSRVIRLAHGAARGTLLATFEHSRADGAPAEYILRKSVDDGLTWTDVTTVPDGPASFFYQPFLFELPTALGRYPAGTLLMTGNVLRSVGDRRQPQLKLWRSADAGATWSFVTTYQIGETGDRRGIWEPFLDIDGRGQLVCYFADERRSAQHSQVIAHVVSTDGGDTWSANPDGSTRVAPGLVLDVASATRGDRPGMPTVATLPDGTRVLAYELCEGARQTCEIRVKTSTNGGASWGSGAADLGSLVQTSDGRYAASSPYIVASPSGQLVLGSMRVRMSSNDAFAPEDFQAVFVNTEGGRGAWSWAPAPLPVPHEDVPSPCYMNYSPHLLLSASGGSLRYTTASQDAQHPCAERTATANAGALPFASSFEGGLAAGWKTYGGCWTVRDGVYSDACGRAGVGNKALAGSTGWQNYELQGDVRIDTPGANAGFLVRLSDPAVGIDSHRGYYVGLDRDLFVGKQSFGYTKLGATPIPNGTPAGQYFHVTAKVMGCAFEVSAKRVGSMDPPVTLAVSDPGCTRSGAVGVRDAGGNASFRNVRVEPL